MPFSVMGCGTMLCGGRGFVRWPKAHEADADAIEALCFLSIPVFPVDTVHASAPVVQVGGQFIKTSYQRLPIKGSKALFWKAFVRQSWYFALLFGLAFAGIGIAVMVSPPNPNDPRRIPGAAPPPAAAFVVVGCPMALLGLIPYVVVTRQDRRDQNIRWLLGRREFALGSSDPATWTKKYLTQVQPASELFGAPTYREAAERFHQARQFEPAILAARLSTALEGGQQGEALTDSILQDPQVVDALAEIRKKPKARPEILASQQAWGAERLFKPTFVRELAGK